MLLRWKPRVSCRPYGGENTLWAEPKHANAHIDADARDSYLVSCFELVSAAAFAVYRMDPHVVVFVPQPWAAVLWAFLPRVLVLIFIHGHQGYNVWFWIHLVTAVVVWGGTGASHNNRRLRRRRS